MPEAQLLHAWAITLPPVVRDHNLTYGISIWTETRCIKLEAFEAISYPPNRHKFADIQSPQT